MFGDSASSSDDRLKFGAGTDLSIFHDGTNSKLQNGTGELIYMSDTHRLRSHSTADNHIVSVDGGAVELYHNNHKSFQTSTHGAQFFAPEGGTCQVFLYADEGDDNADLWGFQASHTSSKFSLINYASGSYENSIVAHGDGAVELYHNNNKKIETHTTGGIIHGDSNQSQLIFKTSDAVTRGSVYAYSDNSIAFLNQAGSYSFRVASDKSATFYNTVNPSANNSYDLGTSSYRWRNIYTNDLNLSNEGSSNDVDGTWGSYTIQEGAEDLFLINKRNGKKYKFNLTEVN